MNRIWHHLKTHTDEARLFWILGIGTVLRFMAITRSSIWHDEGFTMMLAVRGFAQITAGTASDVHPPLYYYLLHIWMWFFGTSELGARSMSAVFSLATVAVVFFMVRRLWGRDAATIAGLFAAVAPFMIRYSEEARMYATVAFFIVAATYVMIRALDYTKNYRLWWLLYAALMVAAVYTHYYAFFALMVHWVYVGSRTVLQPGKLSFWERIKSYLMQGWWWTANALIFILFLPWVPVVITQVTRVSNSFWIQQQWITINTIPDTIYTFLAYIHLDSPFPQIFLLRDAPFALIVIGMLWAIWHRRTHKIASDEDKDATWREGGLFLLYFLLPMALIWTISKLKQPIYQDRYFVFTAVGFYVALGMAVATVHKKWLRNGLVLLTIIVMLVGNVVVYHTTDHQMRVTGRYVLDRFTPGDEIISLDPFTYFDFTYYNHTGTLAKLYGPTLNFTYNEPGLLAHQQRQIQVYNLATVNPSTHRVWIIGKTGNQGYYKLIPSWWQLVREHQAGYTEARLYHID
jgi:uncharacterized membrane protein